ncbi:hypothetical protein AB0H86_09680 [Streptomyces sp. NPDC050997]|uniref:hypothetical protein n=1 Tax=Streptomyces sp. NPDC050997 TaxID=3155519 RepID=UPI00341A8BA2
MGFRASVALDDVAAAVAVAVAVAELDRAVGELGRALGVQKWGSIPMTAAGGATT